MTSKIDGMEITLAGVTYTIAPLTLGQLRRLQTDLNTIIGIQGLPDDAQLSSLVRVVAAALGRNNPEITVEQVEDLVDLGNFKDVVGAVLGASGIVARP